VKAARWGPPPKDAHLCPKMLTFSQRYSRLSKDAHRSVLSMFGVVAAPGASSHRRTTVRPRHFPIFPWHKWKFLAPSMAGDATPAEGSPCDDGRVCSDAARHFFVGRVSPPDFRRAATGLPSAIHRVWEPTLALRGDVPDAPHHNSAGTEPGPQNRIFTRKTQSAKGPTGPAFLGKKFRPPNHRHGALMPVSRLASLKMRFWAITCGYLAV